MIMLAFIIVAVTLYAGARLGGVGVGLAGGLGVLLLGLLGIKPGNVPFDVIEMVMAVVVALAAMQAAGGVAYLVDCSKTVLQHHPRQITLLAPLITYGMALVSGTGHVALSILPVIVEVAKSQGVRPSRPLSMAVVASQIAITASPLSAVVLFVANILAPFGIDYVRLLAIAIPATLAAVILSALLTRLLECKSQDDGIYQTPPHQDGALSPARDSATHPPRYAKRSVLLLLFGILATIAYAIASSEYLGLINDPPLTRNQAMVTAMLTVATLISWLCKVKTEVIPATEIFKSGMSACICILGVAWLGDTFIAAQLGTLKIFASAWLQSHPWSLAIILFLSSSLLYSQAATAKALLPTALAIGISPIMVIAALPAVSGLFVLPTYPTLLAAVALDDTGSTRVGRFVFNHPFLLPGILVVTLSTVFSFLLALLLL